MELTMDAMDILKLSGLFFGSTGVFILYVKYRVLSKTGPLNGAVASIDRIEKGMVTAEEKRVEDHDILVRIDERVERHDIEIASLREDRHEHANMLSAHNLKIGFLEKKAGEG